MGTALLNILLIATLVLTPARPPTPYSASVTEATRVFDFVQREWSLLGKYWFVQVDFAVQGMCYVEWNIQHWPEPLYHREGFIDCNRLARVY